LGIGEAGVGFGTPPPGQVSPGVGGLARPNYAHAGARRRRSVLLGPGSSGAGAASKERRKSVGLGGRRSESLGRLAVTAEEDEDEEGEEEGDVGYVDGDMEVEEVNYFLPVRDDEVEIMLGAGDSAAVLDGEVEGWKREV